MKKMSKEVKRSFVITFLEVTLLMSFFLCLFGTCLFLIGFHNADLGQNLAYLETKLHVNLQDKTLQGNVMQDMGEVYLMGMNQMMQGIVISSAGFLLFGSAYTSISVGWRTKQ